MHEEMVVPLCTSSLRSDLAPVVVLRQTEVINSALTKESTKIICAYALSWIVTHTLFIIRHTLIFEHLQQILKTLAFTICIRLTARA